MEPLGDRFGAADVAAQAERDETFGIDLLTP